MGQVSVLAGDDTRVPLVVFEEPRLVSDEAVSDGSGVSPTAVLAPEPWWLALRLPVQVRGAR
jgi:hypothetical protein